MRTIYPDTSKEAEQSLSQEYKRDIYKKILVALSVLGSATTEQVADYLQVPHDKVWKRFSELCKDEQIHRPGAKLPTRSGRNAFVWKLGKGDNKEEVYRKGNDNAADIAVKIIETSINKTYIQPMLFDDNEREVLKHEK